MRIAADENIPYAPEAFAQLGEVITMPGRAMDADAVKDCDILLVRSVTKVNAGLLDGSRVQFVATATIGEDHIDKAYLDSRGIGFSSAPGSNANSVAEYVVSALLVMAARRGLDLRSQTLGVIGVGNVGGRVVQKAQALGMTCVLNDPPLERITGDPAYRPLGEALECDIVTAHVPLTKEGPDPTHHLLDRGAIARMPDHAILFNTSRGAVVDNAALLIALESGHLRDAALDVWEGEPAIHAPLLQRVGLGTPHIAGYSFDGKVNGTQQIYEAACAFFGVEPAWDPGPHLPPPERPVVEVDSAPPWPEPLAQAVLAVYDIRTDDKALRTILDAPDAERSALFDRLRKEYPRRREFHNTAAAVTPPDEALEAQLGGLGFQRKESLIAHD